MPQRVPPDTHKDVVLDFLHLILRNGRSVAVLDIERRARAVGLLVHGKPISQDKAFRRARERLGVVAFQQARHWHWCITRQMPSDASDGAPPPASDVPSTSDTRSISGVAITMIVPNQSFERSNSDDRDRTAQGENQMDVGSLKAPLGELMAGLRRLRSSHSPPGMHPLHWNAFLQRAGDFIVRWGRRAAFLGWGSADLFAVDNADPTKCGLIWALGAGRIIELDRQSATFEMPSGGRKIFVRRRSLSSVGW